MPSGRSEFVVAVKHARCTELVRMRLPADMKVADLIRKLSERLGPKQLAIASLHWESNSNIELCADLALGNVGRKRLVAEVVDLLAASSSSSAGGRAAPDSAASTRSDVSIGDDHDHDEDHDHDHPSPPSWVEWVLLRRPWVVAAGGVFLALVAATSSTLHIFPARPAGHAPIPPDSVSMALFQGLAAEVACLRARESGDSKLVCEPFVPSVADVQALADTNMGADADGTNAPFSILRVVTLVVLIASIVFLSWFHTHMDDLPPYMQRFIIGKKTSEADGDSSSVAGPPMSKLLAYRLDCWFSSNPYAKGLALLYLSIGLILYGGGFLYAVSGTSLGDALWETLAGVGIDWTFAGYTATHSFYSASGLLSRLVAIASSLGGMFVTALLLGIVSDSIAEKVDDLKQGRSDVLESGHTLIVGWSEKVLDVIAQISLANESEGGGIIVLLSEKDKLETEAAIENFGYDRLGTTVICRQGNPMIIGDLKKVSAGAARAIIVIAEESVPPDQSDARSLRLVLSLVGLRENGGGLAGHVVVEVQDIDNEAVITMVGGESVETIVAHDVIGRLMIQCARQPGLAQVWGDLLGFEGAEFYIKEWPELVGSTFGDVLYRFEDAVPLGILQVTQHPDGSTSTDLVINPPDGVVFKPGDAVCVLAEDDDSYAPAALPFPAIDRSAAWGETLLAPVDHPECILFCGWRRDMDDIIQILDDFVCDGSELHLFNEVGAAEQRERLVQERVQRKRHRDLRNLKVYHHNGRLCSRRDLEQLPMAKFTSAIILANESDTADATNRDSQALATLLLLRDLQAREAQKEESAEAATGGGGGLRRGRSSPTTAAAAAAAAAALGADDSQVIAIPPQAPAGKAAASSRRAESAPPPSNAAHATTPRAPTGGFPASSSSTSLKQAEWSSSNSNNNNNNNNNSCPGAYGSGVFRQTASWATEMRRKCSCVVLSEILDSRTQTLIHEAGISDYVLSNKLVSMTLAMVAEDRQVNNIVKSLFEAEGSEFYLKSAMLYVRPDDDLSFFDVMRYCRNKDPPEIVIGYKRACDDKPVLNPPDKLTQRRWCETDLFVVLAED